MPTVIQLPERPNLEHLKNQARDAAKANGIKRSVAQFNLARTYGFASWSKLKAYVEMVTAFTREPDAVSSDDFLALACLTYGDDSPARVEHAIELLAADPSLAERDVWSAAAAGRLRTVGDASTQGGPFDWEPLMYLCYSRLPMNESDALTTATVLLDAGADPNAGYLWHGLPTPFTALTGVLGSGEGNQPAHPWWESLARLLLERGANANDPQALYNRQFRRGTAHLELLFEFGLGQGDGGPWQKRMNGQMETPKQMVRHQLRWAIHHDMGDRVRLFAERGVDLFEPFDQFPAWATGANGRTPAEFAALCGHTRIVSLLAEYGVTPPQLNEADQFVADVLAGITPTGDGAAARAQRLSLVVQAAATGRAESVRRAVENGFDINALGRADAPVEQPWQTALHTAAERGDIEMVKLLLDLGADASIEDARFRSTPVGWAEHFGYPEIAGLLTT